MDAEQIARVCHDANRTVQALQGDPTIPVSPPWDELTPEDRESVVRGVLDWDGDPAGSHARWVDFKLAHGWSYGPVKDPERRTHPLLIPYSDLPDEARRKDALFGAIVEALR